MGNAFTSLKNLHYVSMAVPIDVGGLASDDLVVDAIDLQGFNGAVAEVAIVVTFGNVAVNVDDFDVVSSASVSLGTPTVVKALTEPLAASDDNRSYVVVLNANDLAQITQRYIGIRVNSGDGALLVAQFAVVRTTQTPESASAAGKNFNGTAKTVTVDWDGLD